MNDRFIIFLLLSLLTGCCGLTKQPGRCVSITHTECSSKGMAYITTVST